MKTYFEHSDKAINAQLLVILLVELAKQRGVQADKLLKGTKLFQQDLAKPQLRIAHQQFVKLISNSLKYLPQADVPFLLGSRLFPMYLGAIGQALKHTRNIESMIRLVTCKQLAIFPFMFMRSAATKQHKYLLFNQAISNESLEYQRFMTEMLVSVLVSIAKQKNIPVSRIECKFPYEKPNHIEQYQAYLPIAYRFSNAAEPPFSSLQVKFDLGLVKTELADSNPVLTAHYLKQITRERQSVGFLQFMMQRLYEQLANRGDISLEWLAEQLGYSAATLKRKLASHGTSYQQLIDSMRQQTAVFLLTEQGFNNEKIAHELKFSDITNFRRSFKRWTGMTPSHFLEMASRTS